MGGTGIEFRVDGRDYSEGWERVSANVELAWVFDHVAAATRIGGRRRGSRRRTRHMRSGGRVGRIWRGHDPRAHRPQDRGAATLIAEHVGISVSAAWPSPSSVAFRIRVT